MFFKKAKIQSEDRKPLTAAGMNLVQLESGKAAKVLKLQGSREMVGKLEAMGIVVGSEIVKKSAILAKGPVVLQKGNVQFAIGYEMAKKILIEPVEVKDRVIS